MRIPAESLSGTSVRDKVVTAAEAVRLIGAMATGWWSRGSWDSVSPRS